MRLVSDHKSDINIDILRDIFPAPDELDRLVEFMSPDPLHASLAVIDPLLPPQSVFKNMRAAQLTYDIRGFSSYARMVSALLQVFSDDRQVARQNLWGLRHFFALAIYAEDYLNVSTSDSTAFEVSVSRQDLADVIAKAQQVTTYLLTSSADEIAHAQVIAAVSDGKFTALERGSLSEALARVLAIAKTNDNIRESRILRRFFQHVFSDVGKDNADQWIGLARKLEKTGV